MPSLHSARKSAKIADVLLILQNPRTPESAKERTLRRLDGLEGRHAPIPKRRSLDSSSSQGSDSIDTKTSSGTTRSSSVRAVDSEASTCRYSISDGVAPLSRHDSERRLASPLAPFSSSGGRRRVAFMNERELPGRDHPFVLPKPSNRNRIQRNTGAASAA